MLHTKLNPNLNLNKTPTPTPSPTPTLPLTLNCYSNKTHINKTKDYSKFLFGFCSPFKQAAIDLKLFTKLNTSGAFQKISFETFFSTHLVCGQVT